MYGCIYYYYLTRAGARLCVVSRRTIRKIKVPIRFVSRSGVKERQDRLPTMYWLPKLHKRPYKARFIANSSSCTTTELSKLLTSCLIAIKAKVIKYCETVYERSGKNMFWPIKKSGEVLSKLKDIGYQATSLSTYDFSILYTTLPHNLIKEKLFDLIEQTFYKKEGKLYTACNDKKAFFTSAHHYRGYHLWSCQNVCGSLSFFLGQYLY